MTVETLSRVARVNGVQISGEDEMLTRETLQQRAYTELLAAVSSNDEKVYVSQLEETEDRLLTGFREAIDDEKDLKIKTILQDHLPRVIASRCSSPLAVTSRTREFGSIFTSPICPTLICAREAASVASHSPTARRPFSSIFILPMTG